MFENHEDHVEAPPDRVTISDIAFKVVASLAPERDDHGAIREIDPRHRYAKRDSVALHVHGQGPFCKFRVAVDRQLAGIYALVVDGSVKYIGQTEDLSKRFNQGYGHISPRNCFVRGRVTNCKVNAHTLAVAKSGRRVHLYFYPTPGQTSSQRMEVEKPFITALAPPWNG